jgi:putative aldouronate transport system permease protein
MVGIKLAFQDFNPVIGLFGKLDWVGLKYFKYMFELPKIWHIIGNTVKIASLKIVMGILVPLIFSLLLNEVRNSRLKRGIQTTIYLPYFISWIVMSGIIIDLLSPSEGLMNRIIGIFGVEPIFFLASNKWFVPVLVVTDVWKNFGYSTIIYLAAICSIDPGLYESAVIDGANKWQQIIHITLPGMSSIIMLLSILSLGSILNAGFDQIFNLLTPIVNDSGMVLDIYIYKIGLLEAKYSLSTAVSLLKSVVGMFLIMISWYLAGKATNYRVF